MSLPSVKALCAQALVLGMAQNHKKLQWTQEVSKRFWDYQSQFPQEYFTFQFGGNIIRRFKKLLKNKKHVLDYGCGTGFLIPHLLASGAEVTGIDFSKKSRECVNELFKNEPRFKGAFESKDLVGKKRFDAIFLIEVVEHLTDDELKKTFADIKELLAPEGILVITTPHDEDLSSTQIYCPECDHVFHRWQHVRSWTVESLSSTVRDGGLTVSSLFTTDFSISFPKNKMGSIKFLLKKWLKKKLPHLVCVAHAS